MAAAIVVSAAVALIVWAIVVAVDPPGRAETRVVPWTRVASTRPTDTTVELRLRPRGAAFLACADPTDMRGRTGVLTLAAGSLFITGTGGGDGFVGVVLGGTGAYSGYAGSFRSTDLADRSGTWTLTLQPGDS